MIGFDRETNFDKPIFRFYEQENDNFREIEQSNFPKQIVIQNMWLTEHYSLIGYEIFDCVQAIIDLDLDNMAFSNTTTAELWICLMTGKEYYEIKDIPDKTWKKLLFEYKRKYNPIKLTKIVQKKNPKPVIKDLDGNPVDKNGNIIQTM